MIQRKQSLYLFFAVICFVLTTFLPLGSVETAGMGIPDTITSLGLRDGDNGNMSYPFFAIPMFFLVMNVFHVIAVIFMYRNRKAQALNCYVLLLMVAVEMAACGFLIKQTCIGEGQTFHAGTAVTLPVVAMIFILLARQGIMADERLIKSIDRIR